MLKLECLSCGTALDVVPEMTGVACGACGASMTVGRTGTTVYLASNTGGVGASPPSGGSGQSSGGLLADLESRLTQEKSKIAGLQEGLAKRRADVWAEHEKALGPYDKRLQVLLTIVGIVWVGGFLAMVVYEAPSPFPVIWLVGVPAYGVILYGISVNYKKRAKAETEKREQELTSADVMSLKSSQDRIRDLESQVARLK